MFGTIAPFHNGLFGRQAESAGSDGERTHKTWRRATDGCHERWRDCTTQAAAVPETETPNAVTATGATNFQAAAQELVGRALDSLGRDLGKLLEGMGALAETIQGLVEGALQPVREALAQGQDFTAEIRLAAVRQQTLVTEAGVAQDLQLLARSLTIEVNHSTGEVNIDLQSLSVEQSSLAVFSGEAPQLLEATGGQPATAAGRGPVDHGLGDFVSRLLRQLDGEGPKAGEAETAAEGGARPLLIEALQDSLAGQRQDTQGHEESGQGPRGHFALRGAERFQNQFGELVTRLQFDVAVQLATQFEMSRLLNSLPPAERSKGLNLSA